MGRFPCPIPKIHVPDFSGVTSLSPSSIAAQRHHRKLTETRDTMKEMCW